MREIKLNQKVVMVPAGKYVLGDPCYVIEDGSWGKLLQSCAFFSTPVGKVDGRHVLGFSTRWGDGEYRDQYGFKYPVDAGLIGLVPIEIAKIEDDKTYPTKIIEFITETRCTRNEDGKLTFGSIVIDTDPPDDEEED